MPVDIGALISKQPGVRNGRACIAGTGVSVRRIAGWYKLGYTAEETAAMYGHISLAQVHAALAYYHSNREEIDDELDLEEKIADEAEAHARTVRK